MHPLPPIKALFFDAAGTLFHLPKSVGWHYREVAARHGCDLPSEAVNSAFRAAWAAARPPAETRTKRPDDDREWWRALVDEVLDACSVGAEFDRSRYFDDVYAEFTKPGVWELFPEVVETLEHLSRRFPLAIVSNFDGRLRQVLEQLGIARYFSHCIISSEVGADKPSPWIFRQALDRAGISAAEALHVGDDPGCDWDGAASAGLRVFRLERPMNSLRDLPARLA